MSLRYSYRIILLVFITGILLTEVDVFKYQSHAYYININYLLSLNQS
jgi:hypothetical protein